MMALSRIRTTLLLPALLALASATAAGRSLALQDGRVLDMETYSCAVLGKELACRMPLAGARVRVESFVEPGPLAQYLIHVGANRDVAVTQALARGEEPVRRTVRITRLDYDGESLYRQAAGISNAPSERIELLDDAPDPLDANSELRRSRLTQ